MREENVKEEKQEEVGKDKTYRKVKFGGRNNHSSFGMVSLTIEPCLENGN